MLVMISKQALLYTLILTKDKESRHLYSLELYV